MGVVDKEMLQSIRVQSDRHVCFLMGHSSYLSHDGSGICRLWCCLPVQLDTAGYASQAVRGLQISR
ncbi:hypothetical protein CKAH01_06198 [Colletotrichum kahawae]|uniref:Uncharacterized protein n=1 Tax=Colletotrichum kahawae TaxID=34407 RepID=A0AAD9YB79_COLKA|nr:hypothetical protein CKAH01_06198 [Colletotrichum kahawae]